MCSGPIVVSVFERSDARTRVCLRTLRNRNIETVQHKERRQAQMILQINALRASAEGNMPVNMSVFTLPNI